MDKILIGVLIISVVLFVYGIYVLSIPSKYQNSGSACEKLTMSTCNSIKNDYYIFGAILIISSLITFSLVLYEFFSTK